MAELGVFPDFQLALARSRGQLWSRALDFCIAPCMRRVPSGVAASAPPGAKAAAWRDFAVVVLVTAIAAILCIRLNISEALLSWTRPRERFQLDELPAVLLVLAVSLIWFSARRHRQARHENVLRSHAEVSLSAALEENRRLAQQYLEIQESERRALARDLHDELGQYLNVVKVDAVTMRDRFARVDAEGHRLAAETIRNIDHIQAVVMGLIRELRPVGLDELGLAAALEHCVGEWGRRLPELSIELTTADGLDGLDEMRRLALFRLVQEALTNVARHSQATRVEIRITREHVAQDSAAHIVVSIEDNGVGLDSDRSGAGLGLIGMRERMEAVGGSLVMRNGHLGGFTLRAEVPLESSR